MSIFRPYIPFLSSELDLGIDTPSRETLNALALASLQCPDSTDHCSSYASALGGRFAARYRGELANAALVLVIVVVEALRGGGILPRAAQVREVRVLVMGVIGRLRCFSPPTASLLVELLASFWQFVDTLWSVPRLDGILRYLEMPSTGVRLRARMEQTSAEPEMPAPVRAHLPPRGSEHEHSPLLDSLEGDAA